jgi:hypothetical protein
MIRSSVREESYVMSPCNPSSTEELKAEVERRSHPVAKFFPLLIDHDPDAWEAFHNSVKNGQEQPILVDADGQVLDGRNRLLACLLHGIEPKFDTRDLKGAEAVSLIERANIRRRHSDKNVLAMQAAKLRKYCQAENLPVPTQKKTAEGIGVSERLVRDAEHLEAEDPDVADEVAQDRMSINAGKRVARLPKDKRDKALKQVRAAGSKRKAKGAVKEATREMAMPGLTGFWSTLLATLKNVTELQAHLRQLPDYLREHPLAASHAADLKRAIEAMQLTDFKGVVAAGDVAIKELEVTIGGRQATAKVAAPEPELTAA